MDINDLLIDTGDVTSDLIASLRFVNDRKYLKNKIKDKQCNCGVGTQGLYGSRDPQTGLTNINLPRNGVVKCFDIGIGKVAQGSKVIAFIPARKETGFVDYKA